MRGASHCAGEEDPSARIDVTAAVIDRWRAGYARQFHRAPYEGELRGWVTARLREEVLCHEALTLGLDPSDSIVRRRLAQKMEFLTAAIVGAAQQAEGALQNFFAENAARYARPARMSSRHVHFSKERHGAEADTLASASLAALHVGASDEEFGAAFLNGFELAERAGEELTALFGPDFAKQLAALPVGAWEGPVASSYGLHLVRTEARADARPVDLATVARRRCATSTPSGAARQTARFSIGCAGDTLSRWTKPHGPRLQVRPANWPDNETLDLHRTAPLGPVLGPCP